MNPCINFIFNKILVIDTSDNAIYNDTAIYAPTPSYMHQHRAICTDTELYAPTQSYVGGRYNHQTSNLLQ